MSDIVNYSVFSIVHGYIY